MAPIQTERLTLRPYTMDDADEAYQQVYQYDEVTRWIGGVPVPDLAAMRAKIQAWHDRDLTPPLGIHVMELENGQLIGTAILSRLPPQLTDVEVGWHLGPAFHGNGYATEAGAALVEAGLRAGIPDIYAVTHPDNVKSQQVARRIGMTPLGRTTSYYDRELELFRITRS